MNSSVWARFPGASVLALVAAFGCGGGQSAAPPPETAAASEAMSSAPPATPQGPDAPPETPAAPAKSTGAGAGPAPSADTDDTGPDTRTMDVIAGVIKAHRQEARACYEKALKKIPGLKGDLVIHFTLTPVGKVKAAEVNMQRSTLSNELTASCVMDVIRSLPFPESSKGMESTVNYPFNFNP